MKLHMVFPVLPPALDGIGDHTANLSEALAKKCRVKVLTAASNALEIPGVTIKKAYAIKPYYHIYDLLQEIERDRPDWIFIQYNAFSYGRRGFNPVLPFVITRMKRRYPDLKFALMIHEPYAASVTWRLAVMSSWQRSQLRALCRTADLVFCSIEAWIDIVRKWYPRKKTSHLPVGSNIPFLPIPRDVARALDDVGQHIQII